MRGVAPNGLVVNDYPRLSEFFEVIDEQQAVIKFIERQIKHSRNANWNTATTFLEQHNEAPI